MTREKIKFVETEFLKTAYLEDGPPNGWPVLLLHGFPYDVHAYDDVTTQLMDHGARVLRPYTRGFGPTRFRTEEVSRSGQQVARATDLVQMSHALGLKKPILAGFDWGGNTACTVAALWPEELRGLVSYASYDIVDVKRMRHPFTPSLENACWYQHLFQSERGRECLEKDRADLCRLLWRQWSPNWKFNEELFERTLPSFNNPDFINVVIHCYRWMQGQAPGDREFQTSEDRLARKPPITVPTVTIDGVDDPLKPGGTQRDESLFTGRHEHVVANTGHAVPQEDPAVFTDAILKVHAWTKEIQ